MTCAIIYVEPLEHQWQLRICNPPSAINIQQLSIMQFFTILKINSDNFLNIVNQLTL
jgi:hypothetical protein